jgi:hypothetical protein
MRDILARLSAYTANDDPLAAAAATIALIVVGNQPFYPLYLHAIAGPAAWPAWLTLLSMPLFLAVPSISRRSSLAGRALLSVVGVGNTLLALKALGRDSGLELFLIPCALLAALLFRPRERLVMAPVMALPFVAYFVLGGSLGPPLHRFSADELSAMLAVNAVSVASLVTLIGLIFASILDRQHVVPTPVSSPELDAASAVRMSARHVMP